MYSDLFSRVYDAFGWNYYPEEFAVLLQRWMEKNQIRVHMQDLGHPIIGDGRYGREDAPNPIGRLALHAFKLCFYHPVTGDLMEFETPYPAEFKKLFLKK